MGEARKISNSPRLQSFKGVFQPDYKNRHAIKGALTMRDLYLMGFKKTAITQRQSVKLNEQPISSLPDTAEIENERIKKSTRVSFMEMLKPFDTDPTNTSEIIRSAREMAKAAGNASAPPVFTRKEKKPKGFNGTVGGWLS